MIKIDVLSVYCSTINNIQVTESAILYPFVCCWVTALTIYNILYIGRYSVINKAEIFICSKIDGTGEHHAKRKYPDSERQISHIL
jgi:hypothetical protein